MYLAIDASTRSIGIAIADEKNVLSSFSVESGRTHSVDLMPSIDFVLKKAGVELCDVKAILLANGPGSFTGLRIAIATAKSLAHVLDIPIYAVSTLKVLSYYGINFDGIICPIMDARRGRVYTTAFDCYCGKELLTEDTLQVEELCAKLDNFNKKIMFVGDGLRVYTEDIKAILKEKAVFGDSSTTLSTGLGLVSLHRNGFTTKYTYLDVPVNYVRKPQAEREKEENDSKKNGA